ncbi:MAG: NAPDH-dependent diflavin reductase [Claussenomyces sp. TS43310]|nr:MAG: NAPDH-dependent diflavin reductase [Claussenomyces sp. TS43310]
MAVVSNGGQRHDRSALILYGSETGNSQDAAEQLGRICQRLRFCTDVVEMDDIRLNQLIEYSLVIFALSTTGQGDFPLNARKFWKSLLRKRLPPDCLGHVCFTTFGLGDSSYVKFNFASRKLHKRLLQLGAQEFYPRGEADEQHEEGTDGAFLPWSLDLKSHLGKNYPLPEGQLPIPEDEFLPPKWVLTLQAERHHSGALLTSSSLVNMDPADVADLSMMEDQKANNLCIKEPLAEDEVERPDDSSPPNDLLPIPLSFTATVMRNRRVTPPSHWQDVRHLSLVIETELDYDPGSIVNIYPKNFPEDVDSLIKLQKWEDLADEPLTFTPTSTSYLDTFYQDSNFLPALRKIPTTEPCTLRSLLLHNLDITAIPRRSFFDVISKFCSDETHRTRLQEFSNPVYSDEFFDFATRPRRSCLEILQDFPTVQFPFKYVLAVFPPLRKRQFSIASGGIQKEQSGHPSEETTRLDLLVAIVKYRTVLKKVRQGVCSRYLTALKPGTDIKVTIQASSFPTLFPCLAKPILLVATGTGIAPIRSLLWERAFQRIECKEPVGSATLIYGGRNKTADFFYRNEWQLDELDMQVFCAWSRDQKEKIYVQDIIRREATLVHKLLVEEEGSVFVCGSSGKMPMGVRAALVDVLVEQGDVERDAAERTIEIMEHQGKYVQETW